MLTTAIIAAASFNIGYRFGSRFVSPPPKEETVQGDGESDEDEEELADGDLAAVTAALMEPCKLVGRPTHSQMFSESRYSRRFLLCVLI